MTAATRPPRAFYRTWRLLNRKRHPTPARLHIVREDGPHAGQQAECGVHGWGVRNSEPHVIDPMPASPPPGLAWCPPCIGKLAARLGRLDIIAGGLAVTGDRLAAHDHGYQETDVP